MASESVTQNRHGVDLGELEEGDRQPIRIAGRLTTAKILRANTAEDTFDIEYEHGWERQKTTVDGDAFRPVVTEVSCPITDEEFAALGDGDRVTVYLRGYETSHACWVDSVDREAEEITVWGEFNGQTISRSIPRSLIYSHS